MNTNCVSKSHIKKQDIAKQKNKQTIIAFPVSQDFQADVKPHEVGALWDDGRWRNNEVFPVCWSRLVSKKKPMAL